MGNLYDDLLALQAIPNAYEEWASYREQLTDFIVDHTGPHTTACIVGAGACNDFDLQRLSMHFRELRLIDRNTDAIRKGVARQNICIRDNQIERIDLLGITDEQYRALANQMLSIIRSEVKCGQLTLSRTESFFLNGIDTAFAERQPDAQTKATGVADYVICCGVHSQLMTVFPQMAKVYQRYVPISERAVLDCVQQKTGDVIRDLNDTLFRWARKGVIIGLERVRLEEPGRIEGAWQTLEDLKRRSCKISAKATLVWSFSSSQKKSYLMDLMLIER